MHQPSPSRLSKGSACVLVALSFLLCPPAGLGQDGPATVLPGLDPERALTQFNLEHWSERDGLPQNFVNSLAQTPDGYLWMGSERGLVRFDGVRFTVFTPEVAPGLTSPWVTALEVGSDGTLWVGTGGGGLVGYRHGIFTPVGEDTGLDGPNIHQLLKDEQGRLWVVSDAGGFHLREGDGFRRFDGGDGLADPRVLALAQGPGESLWVATAAGIQQWDGAGLRLMEPEPALAGVPVQSLLGEADGTLWIGTPGDGVRRFRDGRLSRPDANRELAGLSASVLRRDRQGTLWVGTNGGGLFRIREGVRDGSGVEGPSEISRLTDATGLPSNLIWDLLEDREGNLWLGLNAAGLARLQDGIFETFGRPEGLSMDVALGVRETGDGAIWVGTPGGGVNRIRNGTVTTFTTAEGLGGDMVLSVTEDGEGSVWVGAMGGGVSRIRGDQVESFGVAEGLASSQVTAVHADRSGNLWVGLAGTGLQRWRPGPARLYGASEGWPAGSVTAFLEARDGRLWVGTGEGIARVGEDGVTVIGTAEGLPHGHVTGLHQDGDGGIWVATMAGLARIRDGEVRAFGEAEGLGSAEPMGVIEDDLGYLWISSGAGLLRVLRRDLDAVAEGRMERAPSQTFGRAHGLRSVEANGGVHPSAWRSEDGAIWFPTMAGAVRVDPERTERPLLPPVPVLETLAAGARSFPLHEAPPLELGERTLEFRFSAPTFIAPRDIRFRYLLEGFDPEWIEPRDRRTAFYTNVPPGEYRFRVSAAGTDGAWTEAEMAVPVVVPPYLRERRSVQAATLLLLLLLTGAGFHARIRSLERREAKLLRLVAERERSEAALRRSEERLHLAMEAGRMGTWGWNLATGEVTWSGGMEEILGPAPDSLEGFRDRLRSRARFDDAPDGEEALDRVLDRRSRAFDLDFPIEGPGGEVRHVELRGRWVADTEGTGPEDAHRLVGVAADVSPLIETQRALRAREEELRHAQKMEAVGRLAGGVAHDFNNLLAVIGMNARLALGSVPEDSPAREELEETVRAGDRAAELTRQLLAFSRKQILQPRPLDLNETVRGVERMLRRLIRANVELRTDLDPSLPRILADAGGIEQILVNLLVNAQDAMPEGGTIVIRTALASGRPGAASTILAGPHVLLTVSDTGVGMDEETRRRIFEPFFTTKGLGEGTGLGLASVYGVVQQSGAHIDTWSELGTGTTFTIHFPPMPEEDPGETGPTGASGGRGGEAPGSGPPPTG